MGEKSLSDQICIVGVRKTDYIRGTEKGLGELLVEAFLLACKDAKIQPSEIAGAITPWLTEIRSEDFESNLGIKELNIVVDTR